MAKLPPNDPNVDAPTIVPALVNPDHAPAQPVGLGDGFAPRWIGNNIPNNQNGWIEEDAEEEEKYPEEEPEDDDDDIEMDDEAEKKFKEQDRYFLGLGCDNIEMDRTVRNVMSDLSGLKKLVKGLSDRFDEYERSKVFDAKRVQEKELVNERNGKEFYREFDEYMCRMLQNRQNSGGSFPLPLGS
nr:hypothetical protein [Tanacetum cinerariifolium]